jgi:hypothetical protein
MLTSCCSGELGFELDAGLSCKELVFVMPFELAVNVADCVLSTAAAVTLKTAVLAPAPTVTDAGSVTAGLLLARVMRIGLDAAASRFTEHTCACGPVNDCVPQESDERLAEGVGAGYN